VSWWTRLRRVRPGGLLASPNRASSFHLWWQLPPGRRIVEARVTVEVRTPPAVDRLYFWALQVSFEDRGRHLGAGHTGLQWHPTAPGGAVNWGGYDPGGRELPGSRSDLPAVDSANTRRWSWSPRVPYQLRVWSPTDGAWRAEVTNTVDGATTVIRDLLVPATELTRPVVWAEVFARCDDPPTEARWSDLLVVDTSGIDHAVTVASVTYQPGSSGGCSNTEAVVDGPAFVQRTGLAERRSHRTPLELILQ
jgi:hypothetical protein